MEIQEMMEIEANEKHKRCSIEMLKNKFNKNINILGADKIR